MPLVCFTSQKNINWNSQLLVLKEGPVTSKRGDYGIVLSACFLLIKKKLKKDVEKFEITSLLTWDQNSKVVLNETKGFPILL